MVNLKFYIIIGLRSIQIGVILWGLIQFYLIHKDYCKNDPPKWTRAKPRKRRIVKIFKEDSNLGEYESCLPPKR